MGFSRNDERALLANSGGRCGNPGCRENLLVEYDAKRATVAEMAHIIAHSESGPRGDRDLDPDERDVYDNAVLLCPNCHTLVDEFPERFPAELLHSWKAEREREVEVGAGTPRYDERHDLIREVKRLLRENHAIWLTIGPGGPEGEKAQAQTVGQWHRQLRETVIPNNWRVLDLARHNEHLLTPDELTALAEFRVHVDALTYNAIADEPVEGQILYPQSMQRRFG